MLFQNALNWAYSIWKKSCSCCKNFTLEWDDKDWSHSSFGRHFAWCHDLESCYSFFWPLATTPMTHAMISSGITSSARMIIIICREANGKIRTMPGTGKIAYGVLNHFLMKEPARHTAPVFRTVSVCFNHKTLKCI